MTWEKIKTWAIAGMAVFALFCLGQWARARGIIKDTKRDLAQKVAENAALREQKQRADELAAKKAANETTLREHLDQIEARKRAELAESEKRREEIRDAPDVDRLIEIGRKMREEGKIK